jgi:hypothetical protein
MATPMAKGDRVQDRRRWATRRGTIASDPAFVAGAGRACYVDWDEGGQQLCITHDLKRIVAKPPACNHQYEEQPGEPPVDVCIHCGDRQC